MVKQSNLFRAAFDSREQSLFRFIPNCAGLYRFSSLLECVL